MPTQACGLSRLTRYLMLGFGQRFEVFSIAIWKYPYPARFTTIECKVGSTVAEGDVICNIESMKMENAIVAPLAGKITELKVSPQQLVDIGDLIAVGRHFRFRSNIDKFPGAPIQCGLVVRPSLSPVAGPQLPISHRAMARYCLKVPIKQEGASTPSWQTEPFCFTVRKSCSRPVQRRIPARNTSGRSPH